MTSTAKEIREAQRMTVSLSSDITIVIKKIHLSVFVGLGELPFPQVAIKEDGEQPSTESNLSTIEEARRYSVRTIIAGALIPRFSDQDEDREKDDIAHVDDLGESDLNKLAGEILKWSGFTKEVVAEAEAFRSDELGDNGGRPSGEVSPPSERDTQT